MEQEQLTFPEPLSSPPVFSGVRVTRSLVLCMFCRLLFVLLSFLAIVLSVLRFTDSYYPFGILKLFFRKSFYSFPNKLHVINCHGSGSRKTLSLTVHSVLRKPYVTFHRCFLPNFCSFGYTVSEENIFLKINQPGTRIACGGHFC